MCRDEVLQNREPFTEVRRNRRLNDLARRLRHQPSHPGQLTDLLLTPSRAGVSHDVDRIERTTQVLGVLHFAEHRVGDLLGHVRPEGNHLVLALTVCDGTVQILLLHTEHIVVGPLDQICLHLWNHEVIDPDREPGLRRPVEAEILEVIQHLHRQLETVMEVAVLHKLLQALLLQQTVDERKHLRQSIVEQHPTDRRIHDLALQRLDSGMEHVLVVAAHGEIHEPTAQPKPDRRQGLDVTGFQRETHVVTGPKHSPLALGTGPRLGQVVAAQYDILRRHGNRCTVGRRHDVV